MDEEEKSCRNTFHRLSVSQFLYFVRRENLCSYRSSSYFSRALSRLCPLIHLDPTRPRRDFTRPHPHPPFFSPPLPLPHVARPREMNPSHLELLLALM